VHFAGGLCHYFSIYIFCAVLRKQKKLAHFVDSQLGKKKRSGRFCVVGRPTEPYIPDRFYTLPAPARCKNKGRKSDRGPPVRSPAARRPKNDSRPDFVFITLGIQSNHPILLRPSFGSF
jgi:hypothetical protein